MSHDGTDYEPNQVEWLAEHLAQRDTRIALQVAHIKRLEARIVGYEKLITDALDDLSKMQASLAQYWKLP